MKKKRLKIFAAGSLAIMMGASALCGVLIAPMNSAQATISSPENATTNLTAEEQAKAELDAKILEGGDLGLDPENDPVIFTTESGLDIKFGATNLSSGALSGYAYINVAGTNWVIIGRSTNGFGASHNIVSFYKGYVTGANNISNDTTSAAGKAIVNDAYWHLETIYGGNISISSKEVASAELSTGHVLCLSEKNLGNCTFHSTSSVDSNNYASSACKLKTYITDYYNKNFPDDIKKIIPVQTIKTAWYNGSQTFQTSISAYLFPLATAWVGTVSSDTNYTTQNFMMDTYLGNNNQSNIEKRISYDPSTGKATTYWLRNGSNRAGYSATVWEEGYYNGNNTRHSLGVRPAFVLKLA